MLGYAAIAAFWLSWPAHVHALVAGPQSLTQPGGTDYLSILLDLLRQNRGALPLMAENLLRFFCWQHVLLLPLLLAGFGVAFRDRKAAALALGFILPIVVMGAILPYQGHGFGYRYLHGLLGNAALLGGYAWRRLAPVEPRLRGWFVAATAGTVLVMLPLQATMAHWLYAPFARASARLNASGADYAIVGAEEGPFALDLVLNRPDLSNRPIRLVAGEIDDIDALAARICRPGVQIALPQGSFYGPIWEAFHAKPTDTADRRAAEQAPVFGEAGCSVVFLR
ncbi:MAG: hypothetical protein JF593_08810 [Novosphingobium sp.]|nr:hypothetical protein [Novosphingobium sp.]